MQNYKNHRRMDIGWIVAFLCMLLITVIFILGMNIFYERFGGLSDKIVGILPFAIIGIGWILLLKLRMYATKLQDRIIRQEVTFRYFVMTGKMIDTRITIQQMIALRFAGDNQFVHLCEQSAKLGLNPNDIKELITDWKSDLMRV